MCQLECNRISINVLNLHLYSPPFSNFIKILTGTQPILEQGYKFTFVSMILCMNSNTSGGEVLSSFLL